MDLQPIEVKIVEQFREVSRHGFGTLIVRVQGHKVTSIETGKTEDPQELRIMQGEAERITRGY